MKKMPCSQFCNFRNTVFDHKSPVQPISESRGGPLSVTEQQRCRTTLLHSNIWWILTVHREGCQVWYSLAPWLGRKLDWISQMIERFMEWSRSYQIHNLDTALQWTAHTMHCTASTVLPLVHFFCVCRYLITHTRPSKSKKKWADKFSGWKFYTEELT